MSGQLVGEVFDAREAGLLDDLAPGQLLALVAIAEKCHHASRQGSVRMSRIAAVMGKSESTAKRAVKALREREQGSLVRVVKGGYVSHGEGHANVYELLVQGSPKVTHASEGAEVTQDDPCIADVQGSNRDVHRSSGDVQRSKRPSAEVTQDDPHDGLYDGFNDGPNDGGIARATDLDDDPEPPMFCLRHHPDGTDKPCRGCQRQYDVVWKPWNEKRKRYGRLSARDAKVQGWLDRGDADARRAAINDCNDCDEHGMRELDTGAVRRCDHPASGGAA